MVILYHVTVHVAHHSNPAEKIMAAWKYTLTAHEPADGGGGDPHAVRA